MLIIANKRALIHAQYSIFWENICRNKQLDGDTHSTTYVLIVKSKEIIGKKNRIICCGVFAFILIILTISRYANVTGKLSNVNCHKL